MIHDFVVGASICAAGMILAAIWLKIRGRDISELLKPGSSLTWIVSLLIAYIIWKFLFIENLK
ncbi:MAG: hypothetical protein HY203_10410 [Nitrospirae bacterium]|nr:hypothetical protein [Nitrospirota bacterium]